MSILKSSGAFLTYRGKYLLLLRDNFPHIQNPNTWSILGGMTEEGESSENSLIRELKEEGNIDVTSYQYLFEYPSGETIYHIKLTADQVNNLSLGDEGQELRFFTFEEMLNLPLSSTVKDYIRDYFEQIKNLILEK